MVSLFSRISKITGRTVLHPAFYLAAAVVVVKILFFLMTSRVIIWDEAVYLSLGKWLYSGGASGLWEWIRPIGLPLLLGIFWKAGLRGEQYFMSADIVIALFSAGAAVITYLVAEQLAGKKTAMVSAAACIITPVFFFGSLEIMTGIPSMFLVLLSLYLFMKGRYAMSGVFSGLSFWLRFPSALAFAGICMIFFYDAAAEYAWNKAKKRAGAPNTRTFSGTVAAAKSITSNILRNTGFWKYCLCFVFVVLAYLAYNLLSYGDFLEPLLQASSHQSSISRNIDGAFAGIFYYPYVLFRMNPFLAFSVVPAFFALLPFLFKGFGRLSLCFSGKGGKRTCTRNLFIASAMMLVFLVYFTSIPHKQPRFSLLFLPFVSVFAAAGFFLVVKGLKEYRLLQYFAIATGAFCFAAAIVNDFHVFYALPKEEPGFVDDYFRFAQNNRVSGAILTSDPVPAAYTENLYFPFYNNITDAFIDYGAHIDEVSLVIYTRSSFPCYDEKCFEMRDLLEDKIENDSTLTYNRTWWEDEKLIFTRTMQADGR